jgi:hypothetical protein
MVVVVVGFERERKSRKKRRFFRYKIRKNLLFSFFSFFDNFYRNKKKITENN